MRPLTIVEPLEPLEVARDFIQRAANAETAEDMTAHLTTALMWARGGVSPAARPADTTLPPVRRAESPTDTKEPTT